MVQLETGSYFRDEDAECQAIVDELNELLAEDRHVSQRLPLTAATLIESCIDGVILAKFVNAVKAKTIDMTKIHTDIDLDILRAQRAAAAPTKGSSLSNLFASSSSSSAAASSSSSGSTPHLLQASTRAVFDATSNINRVLEGVGKIGVRVTNCGPQDVVHANRKIVLGLLWQIMRAYLLANVGVSGHPELVYLLEPQEGVQQLCELGPEVILTRWVNYHLKRDGTERRLTNFAEDLEDGEIILRLLRRVAPTVVDLSVVQAGLEAPPEDLTARHKAVLKCAGQAGCRRYITSENLRTKRRDMNVAFLAHVFNKHLGMRLPTDEELEQLQGVINLLKHQLMQAGRKIDASDDQLQGVYQNYGDLIGRLTNQCESLEAQRIQDSQTIERYRDLLAESQELMAQLKAEIERKDAEGRELVERHNREVDRINNLQDRLLGPGKRRNALLDALVTLSEQQERMEAAREARKAAGDDPDGNDNGVGAGGDADDEELERRQANAMLTQTLRAIGLEWPPREHKDALAEMEQLIARCLDAPEARPLVSGPAAAPTARLASESTEDDEDADEDDMDDDEEEAWRRRMQRQQGAGGDDDGDDESSPAGGSSSSSSGSGMRIARRGRKGKRPAGASSGGSSGESLSSGASGTDTSGKKKKKGKRGKKGRRMSPEARRLLAEQRAQAKAVRALEREVAAAQREAAMAAALEDPVERVRRMTRAFVSLHENVFARLKASEDRAARTAAVNEQLFQKVKSIAEQYISDQQRSACRRCGAECKKCRASVKKDKAKHAGEPASTTTAPTNNAGATAKGKAPATATATAATPAAPAVQVSARATVKA